MFTLMFNANFTSEISLKYFDGQSTSSHLPTTWVLTYYWRLPL